VTITRKAFFIRDDDPIRESNPFGNHCSMYRATIKDTITMFGLKIKAILAGIGIFLLGLLKIQSVRLEQAQRDRDQAEADLQFRDDVDTMDEEIGMDYDEKEREADEALDNNEIPEHLRKPRT